MKRVFVGIMVWARVAVLAAFLVGATISLGDRLGVALAANPPAVPEVDELVLVPAALWNKLAAALEYWHAEAQRLRVMKGCG